jgi:bifunctional DNase/RNase
MAENAYLDLDLQFQKAESDYRALVTRSPAGDGQEVTFSRPFTDLELASFVRDIRHRKAAPRRSEASQFGGRLFNAVFAGSVAECLRESLRAARDDAATLRIRLQFPFPDCPELADLPWELLYDEDEARFVALPDGVSVIRYAPPEAEQRPTLATSSLRVLAVKSEPAGHQYPGKAGGARLEESVIDLTGAGLLSFTQLASPTLPEFREAVAREPFHVLHFLGHGEFNERDSGVLLLADHIDGKVQVTGDELGIMLRAQASLRLVVLDVVAADGHRDPFAYLASAMIRQGVPAVVLRPIAAKDSIAIEFAPALYGALVAGQPVDAAVAAARDAIHEISPLEWAAPALYLGTDDSRLFDIGQDSAVTLNAAAAHTTRGNELNEQGHYADAEASYRLALALDPSSVPAHTGLTVALYRMGREAEAGSVGREALELGPDSDARQVIDHILRSLGQAVDPDFTEIEVVGVRIDRRPADQRSDESTPLDEPDNQFTNRSEDQPVLLVKEKLGERFLPIWVNAVEATAIAFAQQGQIPSRPLTHDLMRDILEALRIRLLSVKFVALRDRVVYAELSFSDGSTVSSRPSDATALALRMRAPIYIAPDVMSTAGVEIPGESAEAQPASEQPDDSETTAPQVITGLSATVATFELEVVGVRVEVPSNQPIVLMKEMAGDRYLPIWIGAVEATAIAYAQQGMAFGRPQTHDLMRDILEAVNVRLLNATFVALRDGIYYTDLNFSDGSTVSARPSDAVSLVLRTGARLLVTGEILDEAGVAIPDDEAEATEPDEEAGAPE